MRRATSMLAVLPLVRGYSVAVSGARAVRRIAVGRPVVPPRGSRFFATAAQEDVGGTAGFDALGLSPHLLAGLYEMGIDEPTDIQRLSWPVLRSGSDAVLLDETGTGKTLAYVLPILQAVIEEREGLMAEAVQAAEAAAAAAEAGDAAAAAPTPAGSRRLTLPRMPSQALFLAPNRELVVQVHETVSRLLAHLPASYGIRASALTEPDANGDLDVLVATPAIAQRSWRGVPKGSRHRGPSRVRWVALDEADQLLSGSFKPAVRDRYPVEAILSELKAEAKQGAQTAERSEGREAAEGAGEGWEGGPGSQTAGAAGVDTAGGPRRAGLDTAGGLRRARTELRRARTEEERVGARLRVAAARALSWSSKQFVLVGATMPNAGTRNVESHVLKSFPSAAWVRTGREHRDNKSLRQLFVKVDAEARASALRAAVDKGPQGPIVVFANTLASAEEAMQHLQGFRRAAAFHNKIAPDERRKSLAAFQAGELPVLVCTGLASRGIDFLDVSHVIQYEMATNAVEYMHRIGRTARAGRGGTATALYDDAGQELVEALRSASEKGTPIDETFSRKRLFRKRINKARKLNERPAPAEY